MAVRSRWLAWRPEGRPTFPSHKPTLRERKHLSAGCNQVIEHTHIYQRQRCLQRLRHKLVGTALREGMGLTLSPDKTRITDPATGFQFLGHRVCMRWDDRFGWSPRIEIPKTKAADLRHTTNQIDLRAAKVSNTWSPATAPYEILKECRGGFLRTRRAASS